MKFIVARVRMFLYRCDGCGRRFRRAKPSWWMAWRNFERRYFCCYEEARCLDDDWRVQWA